MKRRPLHPFVLAVGAAMLAAGVVGIALDWSGPGVALIFATGLVCVLLSLVADRIISLIFKHGKTEVHAGLAQEVTTELNMIGLSGVAATYSFVHNQLGNDPNSYAVKIELQDQLVDIVRSNAFSQPVDAAQIDAVLEHGSPAERVLVFGLLQTHTQEATLARLVEGISNPQSGNEQYHALLAARARFPALSADERAALCEAVRSAPYIDEDPDRLELARAIC